MTKHQSGILIIIMVVCCFKIRLLIGSCGSHRWIRCDPGITGTGLLRLLATRGLCVHAMDQSGFQLLYCVDVQWRIQGGGPGGPDPPPFGPRCRLFNIGPKVGPPPFVNVQEWGVFQIF